MAISLVASVSAAPGANGGTTAAIDTTGANLLVLSVAWYGGGTAPTVSDSKGNTYTALTRHDGSLASHRLFYKLAPAVGTGHTFTASGSGSYAAFHAYAFAGVASYQTESGAGQSSGTSLASGSVTPSADGALVFTGTSGNGASTDSVLPSGFTLTTRAYGSGNNLQASAAWQVQTTAAAINPTWGFSPSPGNAAVGTAVFLPASGVSLAVIPSLATLSPPTVTLAAAVVSLPTIGSLTTVSPPTVTSSAPTRVTLVTVEVFVPHITSTRLSQVAVEVFLPHIVPTRWTQQAVEYFQARPAATRLSQTVVELFLVPVEPPPCPLDFPIDPDV